MLDQRTLCHLWPLLASFWFQHYPSSHVPFPGAWPDLLTSRSLCIQGPSLRPLGCVLSCACLTDASFPSGPHGRVPWCRGHVSLPALSQPPCPVLFGDNIHGQLPAPFASCVLPSGDRPKKLLISASNIHILNGSRTGFLIWV